MLRRLIAAAGFAAATITPVWAADKHAPPAKVADEAPYISPTRTSCYVQGLGGAGINGARAADGSGYIESVSASGWTLAVGGGCDVKLQRVVIGVVGRYEVPVQQDKDLFEVKGSWLAAARAGYLLNEGLLVYGLAGLTGTSWDIGDVDQQARGLVLGAGLEVMLTKSLSINAEYTNTQYGKWRDGDVQINPDAHAMRLGLTYRFLGSLFGAP